MAVTAKFQADFSGFLEAIDKAEVALVDFGKGASKVESALNRMVDTFSGRKLIQEANLMVVAIEKAGGVATLTAKELETVGTKANEAAEKMRKLGYDVPPGLQNLADASRGAAESTGLLEGVVTGFITGLSIEKVISFANSVIQLGDQLQTLHDRTDLSTEELQRLRLIAETSGTTVDALAAASFRLGRNLAEGKESTIEALKDLGFTLREVSAMTPDRRLEELAAALAKLDDPLRRDRDGLALLGRQYEELIPSFKALAEDTGTHIRLSEEEVTILSKVSSGFGTLKASIAPVIVQWIDGALHASFFYERLEELGLIAIKLPPVYGDAADGVRKWNEATKAWIEQTKLKTPTLEAALEMDRQFAAAEKEKADQVEKENKALTELAKAYEDYLKSVDAVHKLTFENFKKTNEQFLAEAAKRKDQINAAVVAELQATAKLNEAYGLTANGALPAVTTAYDRYLQKMHELTLTKQEGFSQTAQENLLLKEYTDTLYQEAKAQDAATAAALKAKQPIDDQNESHKQLNQTLVLGVKNLEELNAALSDFYDQFAGGNIGMPGTGSYGTPTPLSFAGYRTPQRLGDWAALGLTRAGGGSVLGGQPYVVGERGAELFVPSSTGTIFPAGGRSSVTNIYITQPLGTPQAIAAAVGAAQLSSLQNRGERFRPTGV